MTPPRTLRVEARGARPRTRRPTQTRPKGRTPRLRAHRPRAISARLCRSSPFVDPDPRVQAPRIPALCVEGLPERTIRGTPLDALGTRIALGDFVEALRPHPQHFSADPRGPRGKEGGGPPLLHGAPRLRLRHTKGLQVGSSVPPAESTIIGTVPDTLRRIANAIGVKPFVPRRPRLPRPDP